MQMLWVSCLLVNLDDSIMMSYSRLPLIQCVQCRCELMHACNKLQVCVLKMAPQSFNISSASGGFMFVLLCVAHVHVCFTVLGGCDTNKHCVSHLNVCCAEMIPRLVITLRNFPQNASALH